MLTGLSVGVSATWGPTGPGLPRIRLAQAPAIFEDPGAPGLFRLGPVALEEPAEAGLVAVWRRDGVPIPGAVATSYRSGPADAGAALDLALTLSSPGFAPLTVLSNVLHIAAASSWIFEGVVIRAIPPVPPMPRVSGFAVEV